MREPAVHRNLSSVRTLFHPVRMHATGERYGGPSNISEGIGEDGMDTVAPKANVMGCWILCKAVE